MTPPERAVAIEEILSDIRKGNTLKDACRKQYITEDCFNKWCQKGLAPPDDPIHRPEFIGLRDRLDEARVDLKMRLEQTYVRHAMGLDDNGNAIVVDTPDGPREVKADLKAIQWWLIKRWWKEYDQQSKVAHQQLKLAKEQNLAALSSEQVQSMFIEMLNANPELKEKALRALGEGNVPDE